MKWPPLRATKYSPRTASNEQVIARNEVDSPTSPTKMKASKEGITATNLSQHSRIAQDAKSTELGS